MRFSRAATSDSPSSPNTNSERDLRGDQDHQQREMQQRMPRRSMHRRMLSCIYIPYERALAWHQENLADNRRIVERLNAIVRRNSEPERTHNAGQLLGIDLSRVTEEKWGKFSHYLVLKYDDVYESEEPHPESKDLRLLGDILQGGKTIHVSDEERKNEPYKDLMTLVHQEWEEWVRRNHT